MTSGRIAERVADRTLEPIREQYRDEVERILRAAHRVMRGKGFAAATVSEILAEAKLWPRAFYRHFKSKDDLLLVMYERESLEVEARIEEALGRATSAAGRLEAWLDETLSVFLTERRAGRTRLLQAEARRVFDERPEVIDRVVERHVATLARVLEEGLRDGSFPGARPREDAETISALVWGLTLSRPGGESVGHDALRDRILRFVLPALAGAPRD